MKVKKWLLAIATFAVMAVVCAVAAGAENTHTAYIKYADNDWEPSIMDYSGRNELGTTWKSTTCDVSDDGTYTVSISNIKNTYVDEETGDERTEAIGGEGAVVLCVEIENLSDDFNMGRFSDGYDELKTEKERMDFAKQKGADVTDVKIIQVKDGITTYVPVDMNKIYFGDIERSGKFRIDIFCMFTDTKYDPPIDTEKIDFNESLSVQFTIVLPKEIQKPTYEYAVLPDETIEIIGYNGSESKAVIPDKIDGKKVTGIGDYAFESCANLTSITIPDSVTNIGEYAFQSCSNLTSITIPDSVPLVGPGAFSNCTNLTSVTIQNGVMYIGNEAFANCTSLTGITIPDSVTWIGRYSFGGCTSLTSITIPKSVTSIGEEAFGYYYDNDMSCSVKYDNFKIYCYSGTAGEQYAKDNGFTYELLDKPTLAKVNGVKLGGRAADALRVNWSKNANASGYIVEMYQGNKWVRIAKITNNNTTTFRKAGLKAGTVYKFRVKAYKMYDITAAYSGYSATVTARTNPSVIKGAKLGGRAADALRINWTKNTTADGYIVEMYKGGKWVRAAKITSNSTTTFRKAGLKASTVYKFRVRAYKMSGKTALYGNYSATVTARTNPSVVKGVKIGGKAKDALRVNWAKNASAQGYIVEMYKGGKWVRVAKITNNSTTTFRKAGLAKNTAYKFRVRAYHMSGKAALYGNYGSVSGKTAVK